MMGVNPDFELILLVMLFQQHFGGSILWPSSGVQSNKKKKEKESFFFRVSNRKFKTSSTIFIQVISFSAIHDLQILP